MKTLPGITLPSELTLVDSAKHGSKLSRRLGEILRTIALVNKLNAAIASVEAERAALRSETGDLGEVYPAYDVIVLCKFTPPRFSSTQLADLNRLYTLASHYGCEPADIKAAERPSKPLRKRSKARLQSKEERAAYYAKKKVKRERKWEEKRLAREFEWQLELATWPPFVPRNPINSLQIVQMAPEKLASLPQFQGFRDRTLSILNADKSAYVAKVSPRKCKHVNKRSHTFSTGEVISLCPDCNKTEGTEVLHVPNLDKPTAASKLFYNMLLKKEGLSVKAGINLAALSYQTPTKMSAIEHAKAYRDRWGGIRVNLHSWTRERDGEEEGGWRELIKKGKLSLSKPTLSSHSDKSVRDYRARGILRRKRIMYQSHLRFLTASGVANALVQRTKAPNIVRTTAANGTTKNKKRRRQQVNEHSGVWPTDLQQAATQRNHHAANDRLTGDYRKGTRTAAAEDVNWLSNQAEYCGTACPFNS
jgi:hypothetical protein